MKQYQYKTDINCSGCIATITPTLDGHANIKEWKVDTANPAKILTIKTDTLDQGEIKAIVEKAGFKAEALA